MRKWVKGAFLVGLIGVAREDILLHDDVKGNVPPEFSLESAHHYTDPYLREARDLCLANDYSTFNCAKYNLLNRFEDFLSSNHILGDHAFLTRSTRKIDHEQAEGRSIPGFAGYLSRKAWEYAAATDLVLEFPQDLTQGDMAPRFIDEVFSEFDTIDNKHEKPQIRNKLKMLFIPLLIILKIFKLKLLFLLPLILGVASFKKLIGFLAILIPGVIGYLKLCRSGMDYGAHGHSNYYNRPPHHRRKDHSGDNSYEPYSPEFANIHPDYLPDYLQESSVKTSDLNKVKDSYSSANQPNYKYTQSGQNYQGYTQNSAYQGQNNEFWKQPDYLPYKGHYAEQSLKSKL